MAFFHLRKTAGDPWPALPDTRYTRLWNAYQELDRTQWLDPAEVERQQLAQVRMLLTHCQEQVPYYREAMLSAGINPAAILSLADFRRLPFLSRQTYQTHFDAIRARALPPGMTAQGQTRTSGTSGMPVQVLQTNAVQLWWTACLLRDLEWSGVDPRGSVVSLRPFPGAKPDEKQRLLDGLTFPEGDGSLNELIETGPAYVMDLHQEPHRQLEWLKHIAPNYIVSYPSNLDFLGRLLRESGTRLLGLRALQVFAETLTEDMQSRIEAAFGVPVKNMYSCTEVGYVASPCPEGHGLHIHAENVLVEVLDEQGQPCRPGERGQLVLTALQNFRSPFIRYQVLDEATLGPERCPCGRGLPLLTRVWGRNRPMVRLPDGRYKSSARLVAAVSKTEGIRQFQAVLRSDHLLVRVAPGPDWTPARADAMVASVHEFFEAPFRVELQTFERLGLSPGGKLVDFINEVES